MSLFKDLISQIDPSSAPPPSAPSPVQRSAAVAPPKPAPKQPLKKPISRPATPVTGAPDNTALKRKASGTIENTQVKAQRKDALPASKPANGAVRSTSTPAVANPNSTDSTTAIPYRGSAPYRGTAASAASKSPAAPPKKPTLQVGTGTAASRPSTLTPRSADPKSATASPVASANGPPKKVGGYMALLAKAKEKDQTKPAAPPIKHDTTKILSKKDREKMRMEARLASKGKKPTVGPPAKGVDAKQVADKEKRKPAAVGYQGTARPSAPIKKPVETGYKGTARPSSAAAPNGRPGAAGAKPKPKPARGRNEYVSWSDDELEMEDEEEEDDYASDVSSDMEGGMWDVEEEESEALKAARREDAEEEKRLKELARQKDERKRKLAALASSNASKRKY